MRILHRFTVILAFVCYTHAFLDLTWSIRSDDERNARANRILASITACFAKTMHVMAINKCDGKLERVHIDYPHLLQIDEKLTINRRAKPNYYIICVEEASDFARVAADLEADARLNPRAFYLVHVASGRRFADVFEVARSYYLRNVLVIDRELVARTDDGNSIDNLTCALLTTMATRRAWNDTELKTALFTLPPYVICDGCPVRGIELDLLSLMQSRLKFRVSYANVSYADWGRKINGTYDNVYGALKRREATTALGMFEMDLLSIDDFDMTYPYLVDKLIWVVPRIDATRSINVVRTDAAALIVVTLVLASISLWTSGRSRRPSSVDYYGRWSNVVLAIFRAFLGGTVTPTPRDSRTRFVLVLWIWTSFTVNAQIQSYLMHFLTYDPSTMSIRSYEELIASDLLVGLYESNYDDDWRDEVTRRVKGRRLYCDAYNVCLNRTVYEKDMAVVAPSRLLEYLIVTRFLDADGDPSVHCIRHAPIQLRFISVCFVKGHPIYEEFERLLGWLKDYGFVQYHVDWYEYYMNSLYNRNVMRRVQWRTKTLDVYNVCFVFYALLAGHSLGLLCFLAEVGLYRFNKRNEQLFGAKQSV